VTATETPARAKSSLLARFAAFIAERHPYALKPALAQALAPNTAVTNVPETTPGVSVNERLHDAVAEVVDACDGFLAVRMFLPSETRRACTSTAQINQRSSSMT
jgi:hypothetical protein